MTLIKLYFVIFMAFLIPFCIGIYLFYKAVRVDRNISFSFFNNLFAGITGGIIVAMFLEIKNKGGSYIGSLIITGVAMLFIGIMTFIITSVPQLKIRQKNKKLNR